MPELPEVETIRRGLERELCGHTIVRVDWRGGPLRHASPRPLRCLQGQRVRHVRRYAKFLYLDVDDGHIIVHLGMTGKLLFCAPDEPERPHTHLILGLDDGRELRYVDPRRFGSIRYTDSHDTATTHYGVDALSPAFTAAHLADRLAASGAPLKAFLLDQTKVAGVGNIYACEALWRAGLSPRRLAKNTPRSRVEPLRKAVVDVLEESLAQGGTSFNDYVDTIGEPGKFLLQLAVFQKEGQPCPRCGAEVRRMAQAGRSTFYCPGCQR